MENIKENDILNVICDYLRWEKVVFWRQNNIPVYDATRKVFRKMPKYSRKGVSDIIILINGKSIFVEAKRPKGKMSDSQKDFKVLVESAGCPYHVCRSLEDIKNVLKGMM